MIVVNLLGGLGNQLFQYSFGKALAHRFNYDLYFDIADFAWYSKHEGLTLPKLGIQLPIADDLTLKEILGWRNSLLCRRFRLYKHLPGSKTVVEPHYHFSEECFRGSDNRYFVGYWQSSRYFADCDAAIKAELQRLSCDYSSYGSLVGEIAGSNSVAIHVRLGDYVRDWRARRTMASCDSNYYRRAISHIRKHVPAPKFFVFSDDPDTVEREGIFPKEFVVVRPTSRPEAHIEFRLMSMCRHFVIANSTFSWWAASIATRPDQVVVAPRVWFRDRTKVTRDLIPSSWKIL